MATVCSAAAAPTTAPAPIPYLQQTMVAGRRWTKEAVSATPAPTPERVQIGFWNTSPSPFWLEGTTIAMYRYTVDGKLTLVTRYSDGSSTVQELIPVSSTQAVRYDIVGNSHENYVVNREALGLYDSDGLIWEATKR